jgi:hypothetical protein
LKIKAYAEPLHSPDGKKRGGADAASLGGPLVMHIVGQRMNTKEKLMKAILFALLFSIR